MIGIVVVSHSRRLAEAAVELACEMVPSDRRPSIEIAAGLDEHTFGTDAEAISAAIEAADGGEGVLVLLDLGSAVLSAEMACEFLDPDAAARVVLSGAPLIEGLVAAVVTASGGAPLAAVAREADAGLAAKREHLGLGEAEAPEPGSAPDADVGDALTWAAVVDTPHGLHARPAAALVSALSGLDAQVWLTNATTGKGPAAGDSLSGVATLDVRQGHEVSASITGAEADRALAALQDFAASGFGEGAGTEAPTGQVAPAVVTAALARLVADPPADDQEPGPADGEQARVDRAFGAVSEHLTALRGGDGEVDAILGAVDVMLRDRALTRGISRAVAAGAAADAATRAQFAELSGTFDRLTDPYLRERGQDVRALRDLVLRALAGQPLARQLPEGPHVLVLPELDAVTAVRLDPVATLGVVTTEGADAGHGAIICHHRGIPFVGGLAEAADLPDGLDVVLDTERGTLTPA